MEQAPFEALLARLASDRDAAAAIYESLRARFIRVFQWERGAQAEALADETLDRVARKLAGGEQIENVQSYAAAVAKLVLRESLTRAVRQIRALERRPVPAKPDIPGARSMACLDACLAKLDPEQRALIVRYYSGEMASRIETRKRIAAELGLEINALRNRALRLRERLESCTRACLAKKRDESGFMDTDR